jgi:hypothetical protein
MLVKTTFISPLPIWSLKNQKIKIKPHEHGVKTTFISPPPIKSLKKFKKKKKNPWTSSENHLHFTSSHIWSLKKDIKKKEKNLISVVEGCLPWLWLLGEGGTAS